MKNIKNIVEIFKKVYNELNIKSSKVRKLDEHEYFEAYLNFSDNQINYSRFSHTIKGHKISGKYLNEKYNNWVKLGIIEKIHSRTLDDYKKTQEAKDSKVLHFDGKITVNKNCSEKKELGRNTQYKSKNSINIQTVTDDTGIPLGFDIIKGSSSEVGNMVAVLEKIKIPDVNHQNKSNKHKKYFTCDAGYDSAQNRKYLQDKGYVDLIWHNKRNTKNINKINEKKLTKLQQEIYKRRHIIENYFSWLENKIPRISKLYDKKIINYKNLLMLANTDLIFGRMCV